MKRIALLIEASKTDHGDLPGARLDVDNFKTYLLTPYGGAWEENEIEIFRNPKKESLELALKRAENVDYAIITFSGHGTHSVQNGLNETKLVINNKEEAKVSELNALCTRQTIIIDACRQIPIVETRMDAAESIAKAARQKFSSSECREKYDEALSKSGTGRVVLYSCDIQESASESYSGGLYTRSLLFGASKWASEFSSNDIYNVRSAHEYASGATTQIERGQHPQAEFGRRLIDSHYPFAVK